MCNETGMRVVFCDECSLEQLLLLLLLLRSDVTELRVALTASYPAAAAADQAGAWSHVTSADLTSDTTTATAMTTTIDQYSSATSGRDCLRWLSSIMYAIPPSLYHWSHATAGIFIITFSVTYCNTAQGSVATQFGCKNIGKGKRPVLDMPSALLRQSDSWPKVVADWHELMILPVSYTHLTLPTNREV